MYSNDPDNRQAYITGLYELADYLAEHAGIPVPEHPTAILVPLGEQEDGGRPDIDYVADEYSWPVQDQDGSYETRRVFGPVTYKIYSLTKARMARHHAQTSYWGSVTPDTPDSSDA